MTKSPTFSFRHMHDVRKDQPNFTIFYADNDSPPNALCYVAVMFMLLHLVSLHRIQRGNDECAIESIAVEVKVIP